MITKQVAQARLSICCLQEVRHRNTGNKIIRLDTGEQYVFIWCGQKRRRDAGVGILIKKCKEITFEEPDVMDARLMAMNIRIRGFNIRIINAYSPTNCGGSENQKDSFYRMIKNACAKKSKHQKLIVAGNFNATTAVSLNTAALMGNKS